MKKSLRITGVMAALLLAAVGISFGQAETKAKSTNNANKAINVTGKPIKSTDATAKSDYVEVHDMVVQGVPLKDPVTLIRSIRAFYKIESKKSEYKVTMTEDHNTLFINIRSNFSAGEVLVEIIDPKGDKQGSYTLKRVESVVNGENTTTQEDQVEGSLAKTFRNTIQGEWIIRIIPQAATGNLEIKVTQALYQ